MRLDGDYCESTMDTLNHLCPKLSPGGFVIIDDVEGRTVFSQRRI
jgi:8-demethyl-8-(2,3-dimethoxy-alpha-L-rhamnosyl)tetracenomycin-C 4'-O-methyltransferase